MDVSVRYSNAIAEVLHYLKGIRQEDLDKIPKEFMNFLKANASNDYNCNFDYTLPINNLHLLKETKGIISMICLDYWCDTKEKKEIFLSKLKSNEKMYQNKLRQKYNPDDIFEKQQAKSMEANKPMAIVQYKNCTLKKIWNRIRSWFKMMKF